MTNNILDQGVLENVCYTQIRLLRFITCIFVLILVLYVYFILQEKLPQAFMQIEWMENDFRNLTAKVWANLDNPLKSYDFSKFWLISGMLPSQVALC